MIRQSRERQGAGNRFTDKGIANPDFENAKKRQPEVEAEIARLAGKLSRLENDTEILKLLEEDSFEWSAQYSDFLVYYCDSEQGEDPEVHHSVWKWLVCAMEVVGGDDPAAEDGAAGLAGRGGQGGGGRGGRGSRGKR